MPPAREKPPLNPWLAALGKAVERKRRERGLTQEGLGSLVDRDHKFAGEIERGHRNLKYMTLVLLTEALQTTPGDLLSLADRFFEAGAGDQPETPASAQTSSTSRNHSASTPRTQP